MLTKEEILAHNQPERRAVHVPEWDGDVCIQEMTGTQRDAWEGAMQSKDTAARAVNFRARYLVRVLVDEAGKPMFTEAEAEALGKVGAKVLDRLFDIALEVNGVRQKDAEELEKNSATTPGAASG